MTRPMANDVALLIARAAAQSGEAIGAGLAARGFPDVRPSHRYALALIADGGASVAGLAAYLGVTKQAASQTVAQLVELGLVERAPDPADGRARRLTLTDRGAACAAAARDAAAEVADRWSARIGAQRAADLRRALAGIVTPGGMRPPW